MSETYLRQWSMLRHIPRSPRKMASSRLLELLEDEGYKVSKRTIERDLTTLSSIFPIQCDDRSRPYGWSWVGSQVFDIPSMDVPVALSFALTSQFLEPLLPLSSRNHLEPHFVQARQVLSNTEKSGQGKWPDKVRILPRGQKLIPPTIEPQVINMIYGALLNELRVKVSYQPRGEEELREYEVNPLGLVFRDATIYVVSSLWDYDDIKQLVMHRIQEATLIDKPCRIPEGFDLDEYINAGEFEYPVNVKPIKLKALFDPYVAKHLIETSLSDDQKVTQHEDGRVLIEATVQDTQELRWWLQGFGMQVEILKPIKIRNEFSTLAQNLTCMYKKY